MFAQVTGCVYCAGKLFPPEELTTGFVEGAKTRRLGGKGLGHSMTNLHHY